MLELAENPLYIEQVHGKLLRLGYHVLSGSPEYVTYQNPKVDKNQRLRQLIVTLDKKRVIRAELRIISPTGIPWEPKITTRRISLSNLSG